MGNLKKGSFMIIKGFPCKIVEITTSKTGRHGHAKASITGTDIFTGKKYEDSVPTSHNVDCPQVAKNEYVLVSIENGVFTYIDSNGEFNEELSLPAGEDDAEWVQK